MGRAQFVKISDLVEDGYLKVDDPKEENRILKAIIQVLVDDWGYCERSVFDVDVKEALENPVLKMKKEEFNFRFDFSGEDECGVLLYDDYDKYDD